jgi:hypothetical protein
VVALGARLSGLLSPGRPPQAPARLTCSLAKGKVSFDHCTALHQAQVSCLAAVPAGGGRALSQGALRASQPLALAPGKRGKGSAQADTRLGGLAGQRRGSCSPPVYRTQGRPLALLPQTADQPRHAWRASIQAAVVRKRPRPEGAVRRALHPWVRHDRRHAFFSPPLPLDHGAVADRHGEGERRKNRQIKPRALGQTVLLTDRQELSDHRMGVAYRHQAKGEDMCRSSQSRRPGRWGPAPHWPDRNRAVHALDCCVARLLRRIVWRRLPDRPLAIGGSLLTERLRGIEEALLVYANGAAPRVITTRSPEQEELFVALDLRPLAEQLGHPVLKP